MYDPGLEKRPDRVDYRYSYCHLGMENESSNYK